MFYFKSTPTAIARAFVERSGSTWPIYNKCTYRSTDINNAKLYTQSCIGITFNSVHLLIPASRSTILQPPSDLDTITLRQDCVDELLHNEELFNNLESVLGRFVDVDTTISLLIQVLQCCFICFFLLVSIGAKHTFWLLWI